MTTVNQIQFDSTVMATGSGEGGRLLITYLESYVNEVRKSIYDGLMSGYSYASILNGLDMNVFNTASKLLTHLKKSIYMLSDGRSYPDSLLKLSPQVPGKDKTIINYNVTNSNMSATNKVIGEAMDKGATRQQNAYTDYQISSSPGNTMNISIPLLLDTLRVPNSVKVKISPKGAVRNLKILVVRNDDKLYLTPIHAFDPTTKDNTQNPVSHFVESISRYSRGIYYYLSISSSDYNSYLNILPWMIGNYHAIFNEDPGYHKRVSNNNRVVDVLDANELFITDLWLTVHTLTKQSYIVADYKDKSNKKRGKKRLKAPVREPGSGRNVVLPFTYANLEAAIYNITRLKAKSDLVASNRLLVATDKMVYSSDGFIKGLKKLPSSGTATVKLPFATAPARKIKEPKYEIKNMYRVFSNGNPTNIYVPNSNFEALVVLTVLQGGSIVNTNTSKSDLTLSEENYNVTSQDYTRDKYNYYTSEVMKYSNVERQGPQNVQGRGYQGPQNVQGWGYQGPQNVQGNQGQQAVYTPPVQAQQAVYTPPVQAQQAVYTPPVQGQTSTVPQNVPSPSPNLGGSVYTEQAQTQSPFEEYMESLAY